MGNMYAFVGSWSLPSEPKGPKGLHIFSYDPQTAALEFIRTIHEEISVGYQVLDKKRGILYLTDESVRPGSGTGGRVLAFALDREKILVEQDSRETLLPKPSYLWLDRTGAYALVAHHSNRGTVTKLARRTDGTFFSTTVTDDAGLALFSVRADGGFGELADYVLTPGKDPLGPHGISHQHCVVASPDGDLFLVCDKGVDCIYSFRLDRDAGKLTLLHTTDVAPGSAPRHAVFHPTLPLVYENNEHRSVLHTYRYEARTGELELLDSLPLLEEGRNVPGASSLALLLHPDGRHLYTSMRGDNSVSVLDIDSRGLPHMGQTVSCGGENPRGLCLSPDRRFLLCTNTGSGNIASFSVSADGRLAPFGEPVPAHSPANLVIAALP